MLKEEYQFYTVFYRNRREQFPTLFMEANTTLTPEAEEDVQKSTHFLMSIDTKGLEILASQISNILKNYTQ